LFDTLILPILTYGCEVWGYETTNLLEKLHLQYCRNIVGVRTTTPNFIINITPRYEEESSIGKFSSHSLKIG
jgi:hypothetical protein